MSEARQELHDPGAMIALQNRGVIMPQMHTVAIGADVPLDAIAAGAVLHPGTRLYGARTRIDAGAELGPGGAAVVDDSWVCAGARVGTLGPVRLERTVVGPHASLGCGSAEYAVFLGNPPGSAHDTAGYGFRVRKGSLYEEGAGSAQHTDTKMTILMPWVTLGSNLNWCDILVAGGTGPRDFSEVGSGAIHFNFTPRGDKATASMLGNVRQGVFLRGQRIFVGGNGSVVGPLRAEFGALSAAGARLVGDLKPGLNLGQAGGAEAGPLRDYDPALIGAGFRRVVPSQLRIIGELAALHAWYGQVRARIAGNGAGDNAGGDAARVALYARGADLVAANITERITRLEEYVALLPASAALHEGAGSAELAAAQRGLADGWPALRAKLEGWRGAHTEAPAALLEALDAAGAAQGGEYTATIQALPDGAVVAGSAWLGGIADGLAEVWEG